MHYTNFHGQPFLFINEDAGEFNKPAKTKEVDLTMHYRTVGEVIHCRFVNKDGSEAKLCGNALLGFMQRKVGLYIFQTKAGKFEGINTGKELRLGMRKKKIYESNENIPHCLAYWFYVNVGNNHHVILHNKQNFKECCKNMKVEKPRMNTHILHQKNKTTFEVRCFERGVGETQACGSGAYAVGSAMMQHFNLEEVNIEMKGGKYTVKKQTLIVKI